MSKKLPRIGSDPLRWIKDTATHEPEPEPQVPATADEEEEGVVGTIPKVAAGQAGPGGKPEKPSKPVKQDGLGKLSKQRGVRKPSSSKELSASRMGLGEGWTRATFIARLDYFEKIKALAYFDRRQLKDVVDEVLAGYLKKRAADLQQAEVLYRGRRVV